MALRRVASKCDCLRKRSMFQKSFGEFQVFVRVPLSQALKTYCGVPERAFTHHTVPKQDYKPWVNHA